MLKTKQTSFMYKQFGHTTTCNACKQRLRYPFCGYRGVILCKAPAVLAKISSDEFVVLQNQVRDLLEEGSWVRVWGMSI